MKIRVRLASDEDANILARLSRIVLAWHAEHYPDDFRADTSQEELEAFFKRQIADEDARVTIAELEGDPVGYIFFRYKPQKGSAFTPPRPRQLFVEHLAVAAGHRRQGVGAALMSFAQAQREHGSEMALETMSLNSAAQAFFIEQGFEVTRLALRKRVAAAEQNG